MQHNKSQTILTIDDEEIIRFSFKNYLEDFGYKVLCAPDGQKGLDIYIKEKPDLVLVDLRMPVMDGLEVLAAFKKLSSDIPVIVVSGTGVISDAIEALRLGAWDYLLKPIEDMSALLHIIEKSLERAKLIQDNRNYQQNLEIKVKERTEELSKKNIELKQINRRLRDIVDTTKKISLCKDFYQFGKKLLEEFGHHMLADGGSIYNIEKNGLKLMHSLDPGHAVDFIPFPLKKDSILQKVILEKEPLLIKNVDEISSLQKSGWENYKNTTILAFPLTGENRNISGVITLHSKKEPPFIEQDKEIGSLLASYS